MTQRNIIPVIRYNDAPAAIDWLEKAFGFDRHMVVPDDNGGIAHAQLTFAGSGMIMLGSTRENDEFGMKSAADLPGTNESVYVILDDVDAHHDRALAAGATIIRAPQDEDYGGRGYTARDPEGNIWSFGSYRP